MPSPTLASPIPQFRQALCGLAFLLTLLPAQQDTATAERAAPKFADGQAQVVEAFKDRSKWIKQHLWVEAPFDSDGDGKPDRLHVDVWRPQQTDTEGLKVPVIYETSPYFAGTDDKAPFWNPDHEVGAQPPARKPAPGVQIRGKAGMISESEVRTWVPRGFAVVHSSSPGTGFSDGCPTVGGANEAEAPKAVIDWLCGRAKGYTQREGGDEVVANWCTGKVGMIGTSYNGTLPLAAATTGVEGLEAIVPIAPNTSSYHYYRSHGLIRHPGGYMGEDIDVLYDFINSGNPDRRTWCNENVRDKELIAGFDRITGDWNDFWAGRDYLLQIGKFRAAMLMSHGWNDWNVMPEHSVRFYVTLKQKGIPCIAFFHQGGHGGPPPLELVNRWFTQYLYGIDSGVDKGPRSWIVREGERPSNPTAYPDYPHPDAKVVKLQLGGNGNKLGQLVHGAAPNDTPKTLTIVDDVSMKGARLAMAEESPNRLLFASPPLQEPLHISGTARITIKLSSSKPAANLSVWLVSLPWTERARITDNVVTRGWADPQNHKSLTESKPLVPGEFVTLSFDLQPDDQVLPVGAQLGLMIFSSDWDFTLRPPAGTELTVELGATALELPVVGGAEALKKAFGR
jgi:X-Pro dipeptidyl-peptidase